MPQPDYEIDLSEEPAPLLERGILARRLGPRVRLIRNLLVARVLEAYAPFGLKSGAHSMMALIHANPGCSQVDLARESVMDKSAVVAIVDDLEARGLAVRERSPTDRRRNTLALTDEGRRVLGEMNQAGDAVEGPLQEALSGEELDQLFSLLDRAYAALSEA